MISRNRESNLWDAYEYLASLLYEHREACWHSGLAIRAYVLFDVLLTGIEVPPQPCCWLHLREAVGEDGEALSFWWVCLGNLRLTRFLSRLAQPEGIMMYVPWLHLGKDEQIWTNNNAKKELTTRLCPYPDITSHHFSFQKSIPFFWNQQGAQDIFYGLWTSRAEVRCKAWKWLNISWHEFFAFGHRIQAMRLNTYRLYDGVRIWNGSQLLQVLYLMNSCRGGIYSQPQSRQHQQLVAGFLIPRVLADACLAMGWWQAMCRWRKHNHVFGVCSFPN